MNPALATVGNLQIDSVIAANGEVGLNFAGGNGGYSAVGARLWARACLLIAQMPQNFPAKWLDELSKAGVSTERVTPIAGFRPEASEWFLYEADGSRQDFIFASVSELIPYGCHFPSEPGTALSLSSEQVVKLKDAVKRASGGRTEPRPVINLSERARQILSDASNVQAVHLAPSSYDMQLALVRALAAQGKMISLDPGHYVKRLRPERLAELLEHVTIFAPSEREVYEFRGECDLEQAANDFAATRHGQVGARACLSFAHAGPDRLRRFVLWWVPRGLLGDRGCAASGALWHGVRVVHRRRVWSELCTAIYA